jgi:hypothetical protein
MMASTRKASPNSEERSMALALQHRISMWERNQNGTTTRQRSN